MKPIADEIRLWPGAAPGSEDLQLTECIEERSADPAVYCDRAVSAITVPTLKVWRPQVPNSASIIVAPGGGYGRVVIDKEGAEVAEWLNTLGFTVFVLKYRLPGEGHAQQSDVPLQDAQRALRLVRAQAAEWGLDAGRIGAMGFSAGGHVIASLATRHDKSVYAQVDGADVLSARPDFVVLLYPVITMRAPFAHQPSLLALLGDEPSEEALATYSCDEQIAKDAPPHFLSMTTDDLSVPAENSIHYYHALHQAGVSVELHAFEHGGHGHAIRLAHGPVAAWRQLLANWFKARKICV